MEVWFSTVKNKIQSNGQICAVASFFVFLIVLSAQKMLQELLSDAFKVNFGTYERDSLKKCS